MIYFAPVSGAPIWITPSNRSKYCRSQLWVMIRTVFPEICWSSCSISAAVFGSSPLAGSSNSSTEAVEHRALAMEIRVISPPDSALPRSPPAWADSSSSGSAAWSACSLAGDSPPKKLMFSSTVPSKRKVLWGT